MGGWGYAPPPVIVSQPARGRSFAGAVLTTLAVTVLGISLTLNFYFLLVAGLASLGSSGSRPAVTEVVRAGDAKTKVYQIEVKGIIDDGLQERFARLIRQVSEDSATRALIVHIDSPGGTVTASDQIFQLLRRFRDHRKLPVVVTQGGLATSGGYYISAAADHVLAHRTTLTGNIGVVMQRFNLSELMTRWGVADATITSTGAKFKDAGSMFRPETPEERAYLQSLMDQAFMTFKDVVVEGRGSRLVGSITEIANGKVYTAQEAKALGLVDGLGDFEDALAYLAKDHNITGPQVVRISETPTLASLLGIVGNLRGGEAKLELSPSALEPLIAPRPMYLWRGD